MRVKSFIRKCIPPIVKDIRRRIHLKDYLYYFEEFATWEDALKRSHEFGGDYEDAKILDQVDEGIQKVRNGEAEYEQDGVVSYVKNNNWQLLSALFYVNSVLAGKGQKISVLDMGGALGSTYFRYRDMITDIEADWCVVEQKHYVDRGREKIPEIKFYYSVEDAIQSENKPNVLLLSSVLMYLDRPYEMLGEMLKNNFEYVIVDENAFFAEEDHKDKIMLQHIPPWIYSAVYPAHIFGLNKFKKFVSNCGYEIKWEWMFTGGSIPIKTNKGMIDTIDKGFLLKNSNKNGA